MDTFGPLLQAWKLDTTIDTNGYRHHKLQSGPECWRDVGELGSGGFGTVCQELCLSGRSKNSMRAVKQIRKSQMGSEARRELDALATFSNSQFPEYREHFVQFLGWFDDARHIYIVMEFFEHGDLQKQMENRGTFPEAEAALITAQVAQALQYMHKKPFIHRDIKPQNILVSRPGPYWHVKVADFGIAKSIDGTIARTQIGTPAYMAPEARSSTSYTTAVDIWSLGAVVYCMRTGSAPSANPTRSLSNSSTLCTDFVTRAMAHVPAQRLTIQQVLAHGWLQIEYTQMGTTRRSEPTTAYKSWSTDRQSQPRQPPASINDPTLTPKSSNVLPNSGQHRSGQENKSDKKWGIFGRHSDTKKVEPKQSPLPQTRQKSGDFVSIAQQFVRFYNHTFDTNRKGLLSVYRDNSMLTFETSSVMGAKGIVEKLSSLPFKKVKHEVLTLDAQPSHGNSIAVLLSGTLKVEDEHGMGYTQLLDIRPDNGSYYILHDIFRLTM